MRNRDRIRFVCDSLVAQGHMDASESVYFARELEHIRAALMEVKYPNNKAFEFVPLSNDVSPVDDQLTIRKGDMVGSAALGSDYSTLGPTAEVFETEESFYIRPIKNGYGYSFHDARRSAQYNKRLPERLAMAARRAIANLLDDILLIGDGTSTYLKLRGLFRLTGTDTYTTPAGVSGSKTWALKTSAEVLADLCAPFTQIITTTKEQLPANRLILPVSSHELLQNRTMGDGNNKSILQEFRERRPGVDIKTSIKLESVGGVGGSGKRTVTYRADSEVVEGIVPVEFEQLAPQIEGYRVVTLCHARTGGVVAHHPKAICYSDEI